MTTIDHEPPVAVPPAGGVTDPGHGDTYTAHMYSVLWTEELGWHQGELMPLRNISLHPGTVGLHYGQNIFEGIKAHRHADGSVAVFRPEDNARRFRASARRLAMPEMPEELFLEAVDQLVTADQAWLSDNPAHSIYLRPLLFATDDNLMLRPSPSFRFLLMAFVAGGFFGDEVESVSVLINREYSRAMPGGTGHVKVAGNYAPTFVAQRMAREKGCAQVVWLDAVERRWVEEMGGMNLCFVRGTGPDAELVTPRLTGTLLPGITRDTLLTLADRLGHKVGEELISVDQWRDECERGVITEVFACGTAAVVTPVTRVVDGDIGWTVGNGEPGEVTMAIRRALFDVQHGHAPDPAGWLRPIPAKA
ncbi:branched-chain amino acid aminotransferase [Streptomyces erythrochromogenes]|uniref:branched-chain amino acid aminotransferase n=1 Tax=Streptomyces erythrochromogenes TaxID=285574 RepID=UPI003693C86E